MKSIAKGILIATLGMTVFGAAAFADTKTAQTSTPPTAPAVTTGSIATEPSFEQRMNECMAIWDKGTHMTKDQWRRSCRTTLQSLSTN
jgi:hypothetical protein